VNLAHFERLLDAALQKAAWWIADEPIWESEDVPSGGDLPDGDLDH
jgi:hypothetical protein